jgi:hypothetical protein
VRGTIEQNVASVTVTGPANSVSATIANRSYAATGITLQPGVNVIEIVGTDSVGKTSGMSITIHYEPLVGRQLEIIGGEGQSAIIDSTLPQPLRMRVLDDAGQPVANKNVIFRVIQGSGVLNPGQTDQGQGVKVGASVAIMEPRPSL